MRDTVRNLNLATSVGIVVYEGIRQLGIEFDGLFEKALTEGG